ncbi:hypothetical protein F0L68_22035 [Solihabitans fulvus]|uniref:Uncharacterized protein n=1 Tax=Solihabitans fulvus TaxID=1892852 RepID=A0A5B2X5N5_9PSEU|nr:hypothetical protein [Solihabitans fulvus]KAA2258543.1 hypothetical protein F0L68_22035 [Solihabitans fulvus]
MPIKRERTAAELEFRLGQSDQPAAVIGAAGDWLAARLAEDGFRWIMSRQTLERRIGTRKEQIHLQSAKGNLTGHSVRFSAQLTVRDTALKAWRQANPGLTLHRDVDQDLLCRHPLGNLVGSVEEGSVEKGTVEEGTVDLTDHRHRSARLAAFLAQIRQTALPWFASTARVQVADLPDLTIGLHAVELAELLVSRGDQDQAQPAAPSEVARQTAAQGSATTAAPGSLGDGLPDGGVAGQAAGDGRVEPSARRVRR